MTTQDQRTQVARPRPLPRVELWLLSLSLFLLPTLLELPVPSVGLALLPFDLPLLILVVLGARTTAGVLRQRAPVTVLAVLLLATTAASVIATPTPQGGFACLRLLEIVVLIAGLRAASSAGQLDVPIWGLLSGALLQGLLSIAEVLHGRQVPVFPLDDRRDLFVFADQVAADGTFTHPYLLAGYALLCVGVALTGRRRWPYSALAAGVAVPVGLTYSRMSVLAALLMSLVLAARWHRSDRPPTAVLAGALVGLFVPAILTSDGWRLRAAQSVTLSSDLDTVSSGRLLLMEQAVVLIQDSPLFGVGTGNYLGALARLRPEETGSYPVHNVPLLVGAEAGVLTGLVMAALLVTVGWCAARHGTVPMCVYAAYLPFLLLDWPYGQQQGVLTFGAWLALVTALSQAPGWTAPRGGERAPSAQRPGCSSPG